MNKERFYTVVIVILLLVNAGTLGYVFTRDTHKRPHREPKDIIIQKLALDDRQQHEFAALRNHHHNRMMELQQEIAHAHHDLFATLKAEYPDTATARRLFTAISHARNEQESITYEHFRSLRAILSPAQQPPFDELVDEIADRVLRDHQQPRGPRP